MKIFELALLTTLLLSVVGCGKEQFGAASQSASTQTDALKSFYTETCAGNTPVKPPVDVLYVVDNSLSTYYLSSEIKTTIVNTVDRLSQDFDYRVIGTPLMETSLGNAEFQVMTNSSDLAGIPSDNRRIGSSAQFDFFTKKAPGSEEKGLSRVYEFINSHIADGLFRKKAYTIIVIISNGRDVTIETANAFNNSVSFNQAAFNLAYQNIASLRTSAKLDPLQLRLMSATAHSSCQNGWMSSRKSYVEMSKLTYQDNGAKATDQAQSATPDSYDLCAGQMTSIFSSVNNAIKKVIVPHVYRYWPITFAENTESVSTSELQVKLKNTETGVEKSLIRGTDWQYLDRGTSSALDIRILPTVGEPVVGRHFIEFMSGHEASHPNCVMVTSVSRTEYFGYIAIPKKPVEASIVVRIKGVNIPQSTTDGWSYVGDTFLTQNTKVPHPNAGDENPPVIKSGYMIKLNGSNNYYKSGDTIEAFYTPAGI